MPLQKFDGETVSDARKKAFARYGHAFTVIETKKATDDAKAWINVLNYSHEQQSPGESALDTNSKDLVPLSLNKIKKIVNDSLRFLEGTKTNGNSEASSEKKFKKLSATQSGPASFSSYNGVVKKNGVLASETYSNNDEQPLTKQISQLNNRFDRLEKLISKQFLGINARYISHPAFQQLLEAKVPQTTVISWFNELLQSGADPYNQQGNFRQQLAQKVGKVLDIAAEKKPARLIFFKGTAGSGKSSLIMKLVRHESLLKNKSCTLVTLQPKKENNYTPLEPFAEKHNISHYLVWNNESLQKVVAGKADFGHLLVEIKGASPAEKSAESFPIVEDFLEITGNDSYEVHAVINATQHHADPATKKVLTDEAVTHIDLTHLDEVASVGHLLPVVQNLSCKARYVSQGTKIPDDVTEFEPAIFGQKLFPQT